VAICAGHWTRSVAGMPAPPPPPPPHPPPFPPNGCVARKWFHPENAHVVDCCPPCCGESVTAVERLSIPATAVGMGRQGAALMSGDTGGNTGTRFRSYGKTVCPSQTIRGFRGTSQGFGANTLGTAGAGNRMSRDGLSNLLASTCDHGLGNKSICRMRWHTGVTRWTRSLASILTMRGSYVTFLPRAKIFYVRYQCPRGRGLRLPVKARRRRCQYGVRRRGRAYRQELTRYAAGQRHHRDIAARSAEARQYHLREEVNGATLTSLMPHSG